MPAWKPYLIAAWDTLGQWLWPFLGSGLAAMWEPGLSFPQRLFRTAAGAIVAGVSAAAVSTIFHFHVSVASAIGFWAGLLAIKSLPVIQTAFVACVQACFAAAPEVFKSWARRPGSTDGGAQ